MVVEVDVVVEGGVVVVEDEVVDVDVVVVVEVLPTPLVRLLLPTSCSLYVVFPITEPPISQLRISAATMRILINMLKSTSLGVILKKV